MQSILFDKPGQQNTDACIELVQQYIKGHDAASVVVASTTGKTALSFHRALKGTSARLVVVTHSVGFKEKGKDEFDQDTRRFLIREDIPIYTGTILTHSLEKSLMDDSRGIYPGYIIANTLRRFGEGTKVAVEIVMEACDGGLVPEDAEVIAVAGTSHGADSVLLIKAKPSKRFLNLEILEILARPRGRGFN
ncbi:MAG TPA: pyruvate kinase alpha/beta domain-containing protein [Desulfomonilia bacterium]|nr:pyruvate kinase alpha/beta domain-containing protein [Desulfomonilia bacterium]